MAIPNITIFVRHSAGCKYEGDEFSRRCNCRKSLRWFKDQKLHRVSAKTRTWAKAEEAKRDLEDQFEGRKPDPDVAAAKLISEAAAVFIQDKQVQGISDSTNGKYTLLLKRLQAYCDGQKVYTVQQINRELITGFCATWESFYPSAITRSKTREKLRAFLRYCYEAQWVPRILEVPKIAVTDEEPETQPLTPDEYKRLLKAIPSAIGSGDPRRRTESNTGRRGFDDEANLCFVVRTFFETMRWSGLAIRDALTLPRTSLEHDSQKNIYRVVTKRSKTGNPVSVPIPRVIAEDLLKAHTLNSSPKYFFWSGNGKPQSATSNWGQRYIAPVFKAAGIESDGNMVSHRLRDTFAVHLLEKGVPMEELSKLLGHKSIRITERHYAKWSKGRQDRADHFVAASW